MTTTIEGDALARAAFNALAFIPKLAKEQFIRIRLEADTIEIAGSDGYTAGKDSAPVHSGPGLPVSLAINREGLVELEQTARAWKKEALALDVTADTLTLAGTGEALSVPLVPLAWEAWALIDRIFAETEARFTVAFDPALFGRFGKVKTDKDRVADYAFSDPEKPALIKVGPTFKGLVMPLYREPAREYAPEGLW